MAERAHVLGRIERREGRLEGRQMAVLVAGLHHNFHEWLIDFECCNLSARTVQRCKQFTEDLLWFSIILSIQVGYLCES